MSTATITKPAPNGRHEREVSAPPDVPFAGYELQAVTPEGARLVKLAEELAEQFATRAAEHDREASYPFEAIEALKQRGFFGAPIPEEFGGLGVASEHDILVASSRLARGDPSVAIGVNMHLKTVSNIARRWRMATAAGNDRHAAKIAQSLEFIARNRVVIAAATSEPNQQLWRPNTIAERTHDGWVINGRKIFGTMSPAADMLIVAVTFVDDSGEEMFGFAQISKAVPGITVHDDWDALGMRASGSHSISFENVHVPSSALRSGFPAGRLTGNLLESYLTSGPAHASASLGIAESAYSLAVKALKDKVSTGAGVNAYTTMTVAQCAIDLGAARSYLDRAGTLIDSYYAAHPSEDGPVEEVKRLFAELQAAKAFISDASQRIVDRALSLSGGAGFFNKHPLSRAYRDVRAGAFMHPLGANRAYDFIAAVELGMEPSVG